MASLRSSSILCIRVLWWPTGRHDKFISVDEQNLALWSLDTSKKTAQGIRNTNLGSTDYEDNKDIVKLIVGKHNLSSPVSSYSRPEVTAKSQSYFFTHSVKEIAVTLTAKGITSKQVLIGTIGDQILALDKRYLDPRRSINPTQAEKEEGIIPLTDTLPIIPQSYVTHALKVENLRGVITVPSKLESTTLMFAHGVDLFFTHLAPSRTYDSLTEDFSYALLLLTIVALVVAIFVTWVLSEKKELNDKWR